MTGQADDRRRQSFLVIGDNPPTRLRRTRLSQIPARPALREDKLLTDMDDTSFAALGAYQFSLSGFLENQLLYRQIGNSAAETGVLTLKLLQTPDLVNIQAAILSTPPIVTLFRYSDMPAYLANRLALRQENLCFTEVTNDLLD